MANKKNKEREGITLNSRRKLLRQLGLGSIFLGIFSNAFSSEIIETDNQIYRKNSIWDPFDFGAKGDGRSIDTKAIQAAVDKCHSLGGGKVLLHGGVFVSGTIILKSNVCLHIESGTTLLASKNLYDYPDINPSLLYLYTTRFTRYLIYAEKATNISISGQGTIDGNGREFPYIRNEDKNRPYILRFSECENVRVRDITFLDSARWIQHYLACENVNIDGITVISQTRENRDGIDIDSCDKVRVSNSSIDAGDDAIVLKATAMKPCKNVTVINCILRSKASALKLGTESNGGYENILFTNCAVYGETTGDAIALEMVDGGKFENVTVSNIVIQNARNALFIRLGNRARSIPGIEKPGKGTMNNIVINNIQATGISNLGCSITGLQDQIIENVTLSNINIQFAGGGTLADANKEIPEKPKSYPSSNMYGMLPVYGFFCRHVRNMIFQNVQINYKDKDLRPGLYCENILGLSIVDFNAKVDSQSKAYFVFRNVKDTMIRGCRPTGSNQAFLEVSGEGTENISLFNNDFSNCKLPATIPDSIAKEVRLSGNIE